MRKSLLFYRLLIRAYKDENLDTDCLEGADLLRAVVGVLDPQLKGSLSIIEQVVPIS